MNAHVGLTSNVTRILHLTNSNGPILFWESNRTLDGTEMPCFLCNPKFYSRFHTRPPVGSVLNQINLVHILTPYFVTILSISACNLHLELLRSPTEKYSRKNFFLNEATSR